MSTKGILVVTESDDQHANIICGRMLQRSINVQRLDTDTFVKVQSTWRIHSDLSGADKSSWLTDEIHAVWDRRRSHTQKASTPVDLFVQLETGGLIASMLNDLEDCRWVNPQASLARARPKISQLRLAKGLGFRVPDTIVTNEIQKLVDFAQHHDGFVVAKPIQAQTLETSDGHLALGTRSLLPENYASAVAFAPCFAQERLKLKAEIRVVMFGHEPHAFRLTPKRGSDDIKQLELGEIRHEKCEVEPQVLEKLRLLMSAYKLEFAAVDLAVVDDDEPIFLEVNPNGQWLWLQYMTGYNLEDPFIDFLCS